ncbi:MAG: NAD(P)-dependent oxidoreductase, partial [Armatimonadetes bacterium]|nr:NAD(P)-dependent oxidoreductase [Armatimonadota bacterium]
MKKLRVLLTGAGGRIGPTLVPPFRERYDLRTYDIKPVPDSPDHRSGDLTDMAALQSAMEGMEVVVHLAATSDEAPFVENLVPNNVVGLYNTYQAAHEAGVRRIVFASTCQTVLIYPHHVTVQATDPVRPSTMYGATKAFGEALGRFYHEKHGLEFIGIRIGWFKTLDDPHFFHPRVADHWLSPRDAV